MKFLMRVAWKFPTSPGRSTELINGCILLITTRILMIIRTWAPFIKRREPLIISRKIQNRISARSLKFLVRVMLRTKIMISKKEVLLMVLRDRRIWLVMILEPIVAQQMNLTIEWFKIRSASIRLGLIKMISRRRRIKTSMAMMFSWKLGNSDREWTSLISRHKTPTPPLWTLNSTQVSSWTHGKTSAEVIDECLLANTNKWQDYQ